MLANIDKSSHFYLLFIEGLVETFARLHFNSVIHTFWPGERQCVFIYHIDCDRCGKVSRKRSRKENRSAR